MRVPAVTKKQRAGRREVARLRADALARARAQREAEELLAAERDAPPPVPGLRSRARSAVWRARHVLAPLVVLGLLHGVGAIVGWAATPAAPATGEGLVAPFGALPVLGWWLLVVGLVWLLRIRKVPRPSSRRWALAVTASAGVWLAWTAKAGIDVTDFWLWAAGAGAALPWWRRRWPRPAAPLPEVEPETLRAQWEANVESSGKALPGAALGIGEAAEHADVYPIELVPGVQTYDIAVAALPKIATGIRTPLERLVLEQHPGEEDPSMLQLKVLRENPGREVQWMVEPWWRDGCVGLGEHVDREGQARLRIYTENSMWSTFVCGGTGIGKSRLVDRVAATLRYAWVTHGVPTTLLYLDGQSGASSPALMEHATVAGGAEDAEAFLCAMEGALEARQRWNRAYGLTGFTPGRVPAGAPYGLPGLLLVIGECHRIFTKQNSRRWSFLAREVRKAGMAILADDQTTDLGEAFGTSDGLRTALLSGNGVGMRIASTSAGDLIPGFPMSLSKLPDIPGYGVTVAAPRSGLRTAPYRSEWSPSRTDAVTVDGRKPAHVLTIEDWFERTADAPLDDVTAQGLGALYLDRHNRAEAARARDLAIVEGRTPAGQDEMRAPNPAVAPAGRGRTVAEQIMVMVRESSEPIPRKVFIDRLGVSASAVTQALRPLRQNGDLVELGGGTYTLPGRETAA